MDIEKIKNEIGADEVIFAMTSGSALYGATNPKDNDVLFVVDKKNATRLHAIYGTDPFIYTINEYQNGFVDDSIFKQFPFLYLCGYADNQAANEGIKNPVLYGENPAKKISLYDNKNRVFRRVIKFGDKNFFHPRVRNKNGNHGCSKLMSWALWYYFAFQNGSLELTKEQQNTIQLCHDGNLPIEHAKELRENIIKMI